MHFLSDQDSGQRYGDRARRWLRVRKAAGGARLGGGLVDYFLGGVYAIVVEGRYQH